MCDRLIVLAGLYLFISGISTKISLLNSINQGDSYGYDTQCYITNFLKDSRNASNWSEESSDDAIVTFKLFRYDPNGYKLISTSESEIKKGIIYALQWKNDNIIARLSTKFDTIIRWKNGEFRNRKMGREVNDGRNIGQMGRVSNCLR